MKLESERKGSFVVENPAMNTLFTIRYPPDTYSDVYHQAAGACFSELERLETLLSRYRSDSDIPRINDLLEGESLFIHQDTYKILRVALDLNQRTGGLFDVTLGQLTLDRQLNRGNSNDAVQAPSGQLAIDPNRPQVTCVRKGRKIDLGGVGKGFALDRMAAILKHRFIREVHV